jgi:hypothetical protein
LAHAQQFPSIESLNESYVACVQSAFVRRRDDFAVKGSLPQATERAFLECQFEEKCPLHNCGSLSTRQYSAIASGRRSEPVHTVAARKRESNNQSHCSFQH